MLMRIFTPYLISECVFVSIQCVIKLLQAMSVALYQASLMGIYQYCFITHVPTKYEQVNALFNKSIKFIDRVNTHYWPSEYT